MRKFYIFIMGIQFICMNASGQVAVSSTPSKLQSFNYYKNWISLTPQSLAQADNSYSYTKLIKSSGSTDGLNMMDFRFNIPSGATITSIVLNLRKFKIGQTEVRDAIVWLITEFEQENYEMSYGPPMQNTTANWPSVATNTYYTWPGSGSFIRNNETVYYQWTPALINNEFFGANIKALLLRGGRGATVYLDKVEITVNYSLTTTTQITKAYSQTRSAGKPSSLDVVIFNNPTPGEFALNAISETSEPFTLRIVDVTGKIIETRHHLVPNKTYTFGSQFAKGIYIGELLQDNKKRKIFKLLKN